MKIDLTNHDITIIKKALNQRVKDMHKFSDDCKKQDMGQASVTFIEMADEAQKVLNKFS